MKKLAISSALASMLAIPGQALEIYNADETKAEIYASIRGFMGYGESTRAGDQAGYLFGLQSNSQFGVRVQSGKFKANIEFGAREADAVPYAGTAQSTAPYRQYWGSYDSGYGVFLFGKTNSPSFDNAFSSNWLNIDSGMVGFGGVVTAKRHVQFQYSIAGFSIGVLEDSNLDGWNANTNQESPRIAANYTINNEKNQPFFRIAGSYKYYNASTINNVVPAGTSAYHIWAGLRPTFGNTFISLVAQYGKNGYLYGEQAAGAYSKGGYTHGNSASVVGLDAQIAGAKIEFGSKLSNELSFIFGVGYQATFKGTDQVKVSETIDNSGAIHSYAAFLQLPYKANANLEFSPQVAYYNTQGKKTSNLVNGGNKQGSVVAGVRVKWDF